MTDVVLLGETMMSLRARGTWRLGADARTSIAGAEATVAIGLSRLGHAARWVGRVGADEPGELVLRTLRAEGVDTSAVARDPDAPTGLILFEQRTPDITRVLYHRAGSAGSRLDRNDVAAGADCDAHYHSALEAGAAQCIRVLRRAGHGLLVDDLDLDLRNAEAHRAYRITDDHGIEILNDRGNVKRRLSSPQLVDAVAAGAVACSALAVATVVFACAEGLDIMPLIQTAETFPVAQAMQIAAIVLGWPCPRVEVSSDEDEIHLFDTPVIDIGFDGHQVRVATTAFTLTSQAPGGVRRVVFHDLPNAPLVVDVEHARGITRGGPFERSLAMLILLHTSRRNDRSAVSRTHWHRAIISAARNAVDDEDGVGTIRRLLTLRKLVRDYGDAEADSALTNLVNAHRVQLTGQAESVTTDLRLGLPGLRDHFRDAGSSA